MPPSDRKPDEDEMLTATQAAKLLGYHPDTIRSWCRDNLMPHTRGPTGTIRLRRSDIAPPDDDESGGGNNSDF